MRKLFLVIALLIAFCFAWAFGAITQSVAQTWHPSNQVTIAWDAVAPLLATDTISYYVYVQFVPTGELLGSIDTANGLAYQEVDVLQATISFSAEGRYYLGVATKRTLEDGAITISQINWSNINGTSTPDPFGVVYYVPPDMPLNLRPQ
jgi:hypothetical protein